jgi:hypothetical protein
VCCVQPGYRFKRAGRRIRGSIAAHRYDQGVVHVHPGAVADRHRQDGIVARAGIKGERQGAHSLIGKVAFVDGDRLARDLVVADRRCSSKVAAVRFASVMTPLSSTVK